MSRRPRHVGRVFADAACYFTVLTKLGRWHDIQFAGRFVAVMDACFVGVIGGCTLHTGGEA